MAHGHVGADGTVGDRTRARAVTSRSLELLQSTSGERRGSLLSVLDTAVTPAGARLLRSRLRTPAIGRDTALSGGGPGGGGGTGWALLGTGPSVSVGVECAEAPSTVLPTINERLDQVAFFHERPHMTADVHARLKVCRSAAECLFQRKRPVC